MPFAPRRVARRTARRTSRRQAYFNAPQEPDYPSQQEYTEPPATPQQPSYFGELEQLAQLKQQGILSQEEYEAKKRQILGL